MDEVGRNKLWQEYMQTGKSEIREQLIAEYAQLVKLVAGRLSMYLGYNVEYDDLVGYGIFGLIDAIDKFDYSKNVKFESYASLRIRGAILDQIRKMDWLPRSIRQKQKKIDAAMSKIETEKGHVATDEEIAEELEITVDELNSWQGQTKASNLISLDEYTETGSLAAPDKLPEFSGTVRYRMKFEARAGRAVLSLGEAYEAVQVWVNGRKAGDAICPPYLFFLEEGMLQDGENELVAEVTNTLAKAHHDNVFDRYWVQEPAGLLGPVKVEYVEE